MSIRLRTFLRHRHRPNIVINAHGQSVPFSQKRRKRQILPPQMSLLKCVPIVTHQHHNKVVFPAVPSSVRRATEAEIAG